MNYPKSRICSNQNTSELIIKGQGVFVFSCELDEKSVEFDIVNDMKEGYHIVMTTDDVRVTCIDPLADPSNNSGLINLKGAYYWFSLDSQNQQLYAGVGECRLETVIYRYKFPQMDNKKFLESLHTINFSEKIKPIRMLRDPITLNIPMIVKSSNEITMESIAKGLHMPKANLSSMAQKLHNCIAGENFVLDTDDFPDFSKAIEASIASPDGWCYKKILDKSREFSKDKPNILETYLRITLGQNNGESPGIPYVMEIWPPNHYSPIHNHAGAEAIIRVLHGSINVSLYPFLCGDKDMIKKFTDVDFIKDDITWISATLNQTHKLENLDPTTTCVTIQCYMYDKWDKSHYDYFDYIDNNGDIQQYEPDSDMDFLDFKDRMKKEWAARKQSKSLFSCFSC